MKNLKNNKKGFTLIELLAVIVILAILVAVAVPAVTRYLASSRKDTYITNALKAVETVREDVAFSGPTKSVYYDLTSVNQLLDRKLSTSPYGAEYKDSSYVLAKYENGMFTYSICIVDDAGNGIGEAEETALSAENATSKVVTGVTCTAPSAAKAVVSTDGSRTEYPSTNTSTGE